MIYTLWTTFNNHSFVVKKAFSTVLLKVSTFLKTKCLKYIFNKKCSSLGQRYKKLVACFNKPKEEERVHIPNFRQKFLSPSKTLRIGPKYFFETKCDDICDYNPQCFMSGDLVLDYIIMNLFTDTTK